MSDFKNFKENSPSNSYLAVLLNPNFYTVIIYRLSNFLYKKKLGILSKLLWLFNRITFAVDIDYRATIGKNFMIIHGIGLVIGAKVKIGDNVKLYQGVTLGGAGTTREVNNEIIEQPIIGDNCIIYTNTCIFGPVIIKDNTKIKACQVIVKDI